MSNYVIFSDLHLTHENQDLAIEVLSNVFSYAEKVNATVIFLGDFFHSKGKQEGKIHFETLLKLFDFLRSYPSMNIILVVGNHDVVSSDLTSLKLLIGPKPNVTIIVKPQIVNLNGLKTFIFPYSTDLKGLEEAIVDARSRAKLCLGHIGIIGAEHYGIQLKDGLDKSVFKDFSYTILGHYHTPQRVSPNIEFVGSVIQNNWSDACIGETKKRIFIHLTYEDNKMISIKRVPIEQPLFIVCDSDKIPEDIPKDSRVRINVVDDNLDTDKLKDELIGNGVKMVEFFQTKKLIKKEKRTNLHVGMSPKEAIITYLNEIDIGEFDEEELMFELGRVMDLT